MVSHQNSHDGGVNVLICYIFYPEKIDGKFYNFTQNAPTYMGRKSLHNIGFHEKRQFFCRKWVKIAKKTVIITLTPRCRLFQISGWHRTRIAGRDFSRQKTGGRGRRQKESLLAGLGIDPRRQRFARRPLDGALRRPETADGLELPGMDFRNLRFGPKVLILESRIEFQPKI
jgi:hypothetical protein